MSDLIVYTSPTCGECSVLKKYLKDHDIPFENRDVTYIECYNQATEDNIKTLPTLICGKTRIEGFNLIRIKELFGNEIH